MAYGIPPLLIVVLAETRENWLGSWETIGTDRAML